MSTELIADPPAELEPALEEIAAQAERLDAEPRFPAEAFERLAHAGVLGATLSQPSFAEELRIVRAVARADGSVGRILDGHFNAVERLRVAGLIDAESSASIASGELLLGVWGADPIAGEGQPARLLAVHGGHVIDGVKTFCSGAGGVDRALVVAAEGRSDRRLAYVDLGHGVHVDRDWYRGSGLRASESHRVEFERATVLAVLGGPGELLREPYFHRDGLRTAATWAGIAAHVFDEAVALLRRRGAPGELISLQAGRMSVAIGAVDRWLDWAARRADLQAPLAGVAIEARVAIAGACRELAAVAAQACGARPLARGEALDRGRRDLDLFLLQHRLDPLLARHGASLLGAADR